MRARRNSYVSKNVKVQRRIFLSASLHLIFLKHSCINVDGEGATEGGVGRGQWEWGDREGGDREWGKGGGEKKGQKKGQMDVMKCLGGMRLQSFLTLFTRAKPGTSASMKYTMSWINQCKVAEAEK